MRVTFALLALLLGTRPHPPTSGRDLIQMMHDRYAGAWYRTLTFTQHNTATDTGGAQTHSTWREFAAIPGRLRIDFLPADSGQGGLYRADSEYIFARDTISRRRAFIHPLMVLGFDVYAVPVDTTIAKLTRVGFDLTELHEDTWQGRPVYVVGAPAGDARHLQFWVDKERLVFVRMLQPGRDTTHVVESRFDDYRPVGRAWVSPRVEFFRDGKPVWLEEYVDMRTDVPLEDAVFDPARFGTARPH